MHSNADTSIYIHSLKTFLKRARKFVIPEFRTQNWLQGNEENPVFKIFYRLGKKEL